MGHSRAHKEELRGPSVDPRAQYAPKPTDTPVTSDTIGPVEQTIPLSDVPTRGQGEEIILEGPKRKKMTRANPSGPNSGRGKKR